LEPKLEDVLAGIVSVLQPFVPAQVANLPKPSLSLVHAEIRGAGIGNYTGMSTDGSVATVEHHAIRVQTIARFSIWGADLFAVDKGVTALNASVFAERDNLQSNGFLKLTFDGTAPAEEMTGLGAWRRNADYDVLYEFAYADTGGASSLIVGIPVDETEPVQRWTVLGDVTRWDNIQTPLLSLRGPAAIAEIAALAFFPDTSQEPTGAVRIERTFDGAPGPADSGTLATFIAQTTARTPARDVYVELPTLPALLANFTPDGYSVDLGDWNNDGHPDHYISARLGLQPPIVLPTIADRLEISYQQPPFDRVAVVYIRASRQGG
jgi:hypothetical protein